MDKKHCTEEEMEKEKEENSQLKQWPTTLAPSPQVTQAAWAKTGLAGWNIHTLNKELIGKVLCGNY